MKLIVGLGNPGKKYKHTRHNAGFILLDKFADEKDLNWKKDKKSASKIVRYEDTLFAKPQKFMNKSGVCVASLVEYYDISLDDLLVVHDDVDLEFLKTKLQRNIGPAGHKGVEDIVVSLRSKDFWRYRVGIGRPEENQVEVEDWVLSRFEPEELEEIQNISLPIGGY